MTEEIIVDGVNVAGCEYLCTNHMGNNCLNHNQDFSMNCKNNNDCYYKQLIRLEQENKELRERLSGKTFFCENCEKQARENEKLKEKVKLRENELANMAEQANMRINTYLSALEEIRDYLNTLSSVDSDFPNTETYLRIQDKIGDVLNEGK